MKNESFLHIEDDQDLELRRGKFGSWVLIWTPSGIPIITNAQNQIALPGGKSKGGESIIGSTQRHLSSIGIDLSRSDLRPVSQVIYGSLDRLYYQTLLCASLADTPDVNPPEDKSLAFVSTDKLRGLDLSSTLTQPGNREGLYGLLAIIDQLGMLP